MNSRRVFNFDDELFLLCSWLYCDRIFSKLCTVTRRCDSRCCTLALLILNVCVCVDVMHIFMYMFYERL